METKCHTLMLICRGKPTMSYLSPSLKRNIILAIKMYSLKTAYASGIHSLETCFTVSSGWIIVTNLILSNGTSRHICKPVASPDDECVKSISGIRIILFIISHNCLPRSNIPQRLERLATKPTALGSVLRACSQSQVGCLKRQYA